MKAMNLYFLAQMKPQEYFSGYEMALSGRKELKLIKEHEQACILQLVEALSACGLGLECYDGFYFSYVISHISKEFDLLKIAGDFGRVLNIELKSQSIDQERIRHQLVQNRYYLRHISSNIDSFTFVAGENRLYRLEGENCLVPADFEELADILMNFGECREGDIETLFTASDFLISPIQTPERFLSHSYFLTTQQNDFKARILQLLGTAGYQCVIGSPGTGKTLLLYDLAATLAPAMSVCLLHCGTITDNHRHLAAMMDNVEIISAEDFLNGNLPEDFQVLLVDEAHRLSRELFTRIRQFIDGSSISCVFACDHRQIMYASEETQDVATQMQKISAEVYKLSDKIRANKELSSFTQTLFDLTRRTGLYSYDCISVIYAADRREALRFAMYYIQRNYIFMNFDTDADDLSGIISDRRSGDVMTVAASGQEFDKVVMFMDNRFYYDAAGSLCASEDPENKRLFRELLFQGISRARESLCLIITGDPVLFDQVNSIKTRIQTKKV